VDEVEESEAPPKGDEAGVTEAEDEESIESIVQDLKRERGQS
jgi:hypothetical protein